MSKSALLVNISKNSKSIDILLAREKLLSGCFTIHRREPEISAVLTLYHSFHLHVY